MENNNNGTTVGDEARRRMLEALWIALYLAIAVVGLTMYALFYKVFFKHYKTRFSQHAFYVLIVNLSIFDIVLLAYTFVIFVPYRIANRRVFAETLDFWLSMFASFTFMGVVNTTALICLNRVCVLMFPMCEKWLFRRPNVYFTITIIYFVAFADVVIFNRVFGCYNHYAPNKGDFVLTCTNNGSTAFRHFIMHPSYLAALITLLYITLGLYVLVKRKTSAYESNRSIGFRHERKIFVQGSIIGVSLLCANLSCVFLPDYERVHQALALINSAINPALYIGFNNVVRREVLRMLCSCCISDKVSPVMAIKIKPVHEENSRKNSQNQALPISSVFLDHDMLYF